MCGDDHPDLFGFGVIPDEKTLVRRALAGLARSMAKGVEKGPPPAKGGKGRGLFGPRIVYVSEDLAPGRRYRIAIAPFFNKTGRKFAGDALSLEFVAGFLGRDGFEVLEPGIVRRAFLSMRVVMDEGVSLERAGALRRGRCGPRARGEVLDYQDVRGDYGVPKVMFTVQLLDRTTKKVVWSSESDNYGDDSLLPFDLGKVRTAHLMAERMVGSIAGMLSRR